MQRIGIAASKMAKGDLLKYNFFVIAIAFCACLLVFFACSFSLVAVLFALSLILSPFVPADFSATWLRIGKISIVALALLVGILGLIAVCQNLKISKNKL